jgi:hypothetical protein
LPTKGKEMNVKAAPSFGVDEARSSDQETGGFLTTMPALVGVDRLQEMVRQDYPPFNTFNMVHPIMLTYLGIISENTGATDADTNLTEVVPVDYHT